MKKIFSGDINTVDLPLTGLELAPGIWLKNWRGFKRARFIQFPEYLPPQTSSVGQGSMAWNSLREMFLREEETE